MKLVFGKDTGNDTADRCSPPYLFRKNNNLLNFVDYFQEKYKQFILASRKNTGLYSFKAERQNIKQSDFAITNHLKDILEEPKKEQALIPALVLGEIGLVHSLGMEGIPVYVGSEEKDNPSLYSRYTEKKVLFSSYRSEDFIEELCNFGKTLHQKPVVFSDDDAAILNISRHRDRLSNHYRFALPGHDIVEQVLDKQKFCELVETHDLPAPKSVQVSSEKELDKVIPDIGFPCAVKPAYRSDWYHEDFYQTVGSYKKAYRCSTENELKSLYGKVKKINPSIVLQEYIVGEDHLHYSVNMYVDEKGKMRGHYIAQKLRTYPIGAGMGSFITTLLDEEILERALYVVNALNLRGLLNIQFKRDSRTKEPKLLEVHFRNSVWGFLGPAAGINLYLQYYNDLNFIKQSFPESYDVGVKYVDLRRDIPALLQYRSSGQLTIHEWLLSLKGKLILGGYNFKDPLPILVSLWIKLKKSVRYLFRK